MSKEGNVKATSRTRYRSVDTEVDADGNTVKRVVKDFTVVKDKDPFFRVYIDHLALLNRFSNTQKKFLFAVAALVEFDTNKICFNGETNPKIEKLAAITSGQRRTCISSLTKMGILVKVAHLVYQLSPNMFFKGSDVERSNILVMEYRFHLKDKKQTKAIAPNEDFDKED